MRLRDWLWRTGLEDKADKLWSEIMWCVYPESERGRVEARLRKWAGPSMDIKATALAGWDTKLESRKRLRAVLVGLAAAVTTVSQLVGIIGRFFT